MNPNDLVVVTVFPMQMSVYHRFHMYCELVLILWLVFAFEVQLREAFERV